MTLNALLYYVINQMLTLIFLIPLWFPLREKKEKQRKRCKISQVSALRSVHFAAFYSANDTLGIRAHIRPGSIEDTIYLWRKLFRRKQTLPHLQVLWCLYTSENMIFFRASSQTVYCEVTNFPPRGLKLTLMYNCTHLALKVFSRRTRACVFLHECLCVVMVTVLLMSHHRAERSLVNILPQLQLSLKNVIIIHSAPCPWARPTFVFISQISRHESSCMNLLSTGTEEQEKK